MIIRTSMAHICATGTTGRLKSWHIYVPLALDGLSGLQERLEYTGIVNKHMQQRHISE